MTAAHGPSPGPSPQRADTASASQLTGIGLALGGVIALSPDALLVRLIETDPATLLFWRCLLQALTLLVTLALIYRGRLPAMIRAIGWTGVGAALAFATSTTLFVLSIRLTAAANTLFILATAPLCAALISWLALGERVAPRTWVAIALALVGIGVIFAGGLGGGTLLGDLLALGAAFSLATQLSIVRHARAVNLIPALALGTLLVAVVTGLGFATPLSADRGDALWLVLLGVLVLPVAFGLLTLAPRHIPSPEVGLIMQLEAVLGPLWVWLGVGEIPPLTTFIGGAILLATLLVHSALGIRGQRGRA